MEITIHTDRDGESYLLTTDSPASHYGIPALRYTGCACPDYGPADPLCRHASPDTRIDICGAWTAAEAVSLYVSSDDPPETQQAARRFLAQWPEGPQLSHTGEAMELQPFDIVRCIQYPRPDDTPNPLGHVGIIQAIEYTAEDDVAYYLVDFREYATAWQVMLPGELERVAPW